MSDGLMCSFPATRQSGVTDLGRRKLALASETALLPLLLLLVLAVGSWHIRFSRWEGSWHLRLRPWEGPGALSWHQRARSWEGSWHQRFGCGRAHGTRVSFAGLLLRRTLCHRLALPGRSIRRCSRSSRAPSNLSSLSNYSFRDSVQLEGGGHRNSRSPPPLAQGKVGQVGHCGPQRERGT